MGSALSPLCWPQHWQGQTDKHTWNTTITTYYRITLCTSTQTTARTRKRARAVSGGGREEAAEPNYPPRLWVLSLAALAHQNRTIAIASDFRVDGAKSPESRKKEEGLGSEIAARNRQSLATFHSTLKLQCSIAFSCQSQIAFIAAISVRQAYRCFCCGSVAPSCPGQPSTSNSSPTSFMTVTGLAADNARWARGHSK